MSGIDCLQFIKSAQNTSHISVIILTGSKKSEIIKEVYLAGAADYLIKPIVPNLLLERIKFNLTINFELQDIYNLLHNLHQKEPNILMQPGLKGYFKNDAHCYPLLYQTHKLCFIFPKEYKPKIFIGAAQDFLTTHLRIFMRNTVRWNQIWPPRISLEYPGTSAVKIENNSIQNNKDSAPIQKTYEISFEKYPIKEISEFKKDVIGKVPTIKPPLWKSLVGSSGFTMGTPI